MSDVHRTILACRETLAAGLGQRRGGMRPARAGLSVDLAGMPDSVNVSVREGYPSIVERLDPADLDDVHADAVTKAWRDGAWDIRVHALPPLAGTELMLISHRQFADGGLRDQLLAAAERGSLVTWLWLPMRDGPALRRAAHAKKDRTLDKEAGRAGPAPENLLRTKWKWTSWRDRTIRLGEWSDEHRPKPRQPRYGASARATDAQRGYIVALRRRAGREGEPLPAALTRGEASAIIDDLLGSAS